MVNTPLASVTGTSLLGYVSRSFAYLDLDIFLPIPLCKIAQTVRLDRYCWIFHQSEFCTFRFLGLNLSSVALALCFEILFFWKLNNFASHTSLGLNFLQHYPDHFPSPGWCWRKASQHDAINTMFHQAFLFFRYHYHYGCHHITQFQLIEGTTWADAMFEKISSTCKMKGYYLTLKNPGLILILLC